MSNIKEVHGKPRLYVSVNLIFGVWLPCCATPSAPPASSSLYIHAHEQWILFIVRVSGACLPLQMLYQNIYIMNAYIFTTQRGWRGQVAEFEGCRIHPICNGVVKLVTVHDGSWLLVTVCQVVTCWWSSIVLCTYIYLLNVCGAIILQWGILSHFWLFVLFVSRCELSRTITHYGSGYWRCMENLEECYPLECILICFAVWEIHVHVSLDLLWQERYTYM